MRNLILSLALLGALLTGSLLLLDLAEARHGRKTPLARDPARGKSSGTDSPAPDTPPGQTAAKAPTAGKQDGAPPTNNPLPGDLFALLDALQQGKQSSASGSGRTNNTRPAASGSGLAIVSIPYTPLYTAPAGKKGVATVTLLYRGNTLNVTGPEQGGYLPCRVFGTNGFVRTTAVEPLTGSELGRFPALVSTTGESTPERVVELARRAFSRSDRLALLRLVFQRLAVSCSGWDTLRFVVTEEDLRNRPAHLPLSTTPYRQSFSLNRLFQLGRRQLSGRGRMERDDDRCRWTVPDGSKLVICRKGRRWFLEGIMFRQTMLP